MKKYNSYLIRLVSVCFVLVLSAVYVPAQAQWLNANPGSGGQLQHLVCDPNIDGKMFLCSDVEGYYVSYDYGGHWESYSFQSPFNNIFNIAVAPTDSKKLLMGSTYGLATSNDGGENWTVVSSFIGTPVSAMAIDPQDENKMYIAPSWLEDKVRHFAESGSRDMYYSTDGGGTWKKSTYVSGSADRNVLTITIHPQNGDVLLGGLSGVYQSTNGAVSWSPIAAPSNTLRCFGSEISPDGNWIYAIYERSDNNSGLYVRAYDNGTWQELDANGVLQDRDQLHWRPVIDPSSTATEHHLMIGTLLRGGNGTSNALLEADVTISGTTFDVEVSEAFKYTGSEQMVEVGWNKYQGVSRTYAYYPKSWTDYSYERGALVMSQQTAYVGDLTDIESWKSVSSYEAKKLAGQPFYRTTGTASTFNWDMAGHQNYVVQTLADNGFLESFDGGFSWNQPNTVQSGNWNGDAAETVVKVGKKTLVLLGTANGFGGAVTDWNGRLLYKELTDLNGPTDLWKTLIDGKSSNKKGLVNNTRVINISSDPQVPERVYIATIGGSYVTDDIYELVAGNSAHNFRKITYGDTDVPARKIMPDPNNPDRVFLRCTNGTFRGARQANGSYVWTEVFYNGSDDGLKSNWGSNGDMTVWSNEATTYLLLTKGDDSSTDFELLLSSDFGATFTKVVDRQKALTIRNPDFISTFNAKTGFGGLCGSGNQFYFTFHVRQHGEEISKGIAFIKATIGASLDEVNLQDWTGTVGANFIEFPVARRGKIWQDETGKNHIYLATMGAGMWKRAIKKTEAPNAFFTTDTTKVQIPGKINFDGSQSAPYQDRTIEEYHWNFGDGSTGTGAQIAHEYTTEGAYTVTLTVIDSEGDDDEISIRVEAVNLNLQSKIISPFKSGFSPLYVHLDGTTSVNPKGNIASYSWTIGGEEVGNEADLLVHLIQPGKYTYSLTVTDDLGNTDTQSTTIDAVEFTGESGDYVTLLTEDMEGFAIQDPQNNGQQWGGVPRFGVLADDNTSSLHYATVWGVHASSGYEGASGQFSAFIQPNDEIFALDSINTSGYDNVRLSFGMMKTSIVEDVAVVNQDDGAGIRFEYAANDGEWTEVSLVGKFTYDNQQNDIWYYIELTDEFPSVENLRLRWTRLGSATPYDTYWRVDDIMVLAPAGVNMGLPQVTLKSDKSEALRQEEVTLSLGVSGTASLIEWDFGKNASPKIGFGAGPHKVKFSKSGSETVKVRVINQVGEAKAEKVITVGEVLAPIQGIIIASKDEVGLKQDVVFYVKHEGEGRDYVWDFGADASPTSATGKGPHLVSYKTEGWQSVKLAVENNYGLKSEISADNIVLVSASVLGTDKQTQLILFPNPAEDLVLIGNVRSEKTQVKIFDLTGQLILTQMVEPSKGIDISRFESGMYLLRLFQENELIGTHKLIKK